MAQNRRKFLNDFSAGFEPFSIDLHTLSVGYATNGGGTEGAALRAAKANPTIALNHLTPELPQVYNVDGVQTVVMPLIGAASGFQGVALSAVADVNDVAWGPGASAAVQNYRARLVARGRGAELGRGAETVPVDGVIDRIAWVPGGQDYQFDLVGDRRMFVASMIGFPTLVLTRSGDPVSFRTPTTDAAVLPAIGFLNRAAGFAGTSATLPTPR